ncbi:hypothetical protein C8R46DRAFT_1214735 [Mycena filopes]|nr:hypothetical protein C8R46DRAFT_1214735 [Mycena filopes]
MERARWTNACSSATSSPLWHEGVCEWLTQRTIVSRYIDVPDALRPYPNLPFRAPAQENSSPSPRAALCVHHQSTLLYLYAVVTLTLLDAILHRPHALPLPLGAVRSTEPHRRLQAKDAGRGGTNSVSTLTRTSPPPSRPCLGQPVPFSLSCDDRLPLLRPPKEESVSFRPDASGSSIHPSDPGRRIRAGLKIHVYNLSALSAYILTRLSYRLYMQRFAQPTSIHTRPPPPRLPSPHPVRLRVCRTFPHLCGAGALVGITPQDPTHRTPRAANADAPPRRESRLSISHALAAIVRALSTRGLLLARSHRPVQRAGSGKIQRRGRHAGTRERDTMGERGWAYVWSNVKRVRGGQSLRRTTS